MKFFLTSALFPICAVAFAPSATFQHTTTAATNSLLSSTTSTSLEASGLATAGLSTAELPEQLYFPKEKEAPKVLGGIKIGRRKLTVVTGASSGLGLSTTATLVNTGRHFVVMAVRDVEKGKQGTNETRICICKKYTTTTTLLLFITC
jgi:protochlorophyllide reductase